ncbi:MAG: hypothetical protein HPY53_01715 [Brevinematales bacterium]|nr:hypothetical protein [Brevinematales bacterium]
MSLHVITLTPEELEALKKVHQYLYQDEKEHYEQYQEELKNEGLSEEMIEEEKKGHICYSLEILEEILKKFL